MTKYTQIQNFWRHYLGDIDPVPAYAEPARSDNLAGLPPAHILAAQYNPFRDEEMDYARRLSAVDVPTELHLIPGAVHGF